MPMGPANQARPSTARLVPLVKFFTIAVDGLQSPQGPNRDCRTPARPPPRPGGRGVRGWVDRGLEPRRPAAAEPDEARGLLTTVEF